MTASVVSSYGRQLLEENRGSSLVINDEPLDGEALEAAGIRFDAVVALEVPDDVIVHRMGGRRVCEHCGASYHIVNVPPRQEGVCDECGGKLVQRKDDIPETVQSRLKEYHETTEPLKTFYGDRGLLKVVDNYPTVEETTAAVLAALGYEQ